MFAIPSDDPDLIYCVVTTIHVEANVETRSSWWGTHQKASASSCSATITFVKLYVKKGFEDPLHS
jgi:hypothetical protein